MIVPHDHTPAWLFSFVDLAFLLLIAMTQVGGDRSDVGLELGEIIVPRVGGEATMELPTGAPDRWQLRVHPPGPEPAEAGTEASPFELAGPVDDAAAPAARLSLAELREELVRLHQAAAKKPLLAPHGDSRSADMLEATGLLEELWPQRRRATVAPVFARR